MIHLVLFQPEIPHNTGALGRLSLGTGARLHLIKPLGFSLDDKHLKRVGLDYWKEVDLRVWEDWSAFLSESGCDISRFFLLSTKGGQAHWDLDFRSPEDVWLIFGPETRGLPASLLAQHPPRVVRIPMHGTRSLNLSTAAAITLYEVLRQRRQAGLADASLLD
ncbi:MAG: tRNA (cytidine(34)-2'-O)-methyltransferase [Verrucomicrobiales bacterium]|nr:tRNA (cytidine(34)-2'-O)-methyltransferase [Verrucomicrobiales bacterium]